MSTAHWMRRLGLMLCALACGAAAYGQESRYEGDVTNVRVVRHVEKHPQAWRLWQPYIIQGQKQKHLIVAFGAMRNGKKDMGDILATVSKDDGHTWSPAVPEPELHNAKSKSFFGRASHGTHIYVYSDGPAQRDIAPGFPQGGRTSLRYKIKPAGGTADTARTHIHFGKLKIDP